jgi:hypothetical protein
MADNFSCSPAPCEPISEPSARKLGDCIDHPANSDDSQCICPWPPLHLAGKQTATLEGENDRSEVNAMNDKAAELDIGQNVPISWLRQKHEVQAFLLAESAEDQEAEPAAASTRTIEAGVCQVACNAYHTGSSNNA